MPTYNPNDFYPSSGARVDSQGNVRNTADGFNADGSENVQLEGTAPTFVQQGTVNTASGVQYPTTVNINVPNKTFRKLTLAVHNATGQTISSVSFVAQNASFGAYTGTDTVINGKGISIGTNNSAGVVNLFCDNTDAYPFLFNTPIQVQFNLAAATTATGTIDWVLYGM